MSSMEKDIGALKEGMGWIKQEISLLREDVKALNHFKWRMAGGAALLSIILTIVVEVIRR